VRVLLHRLFHNPSVRVVGREGDRTHLEVEGLFCDDVCAARTRRSFERIEGVRAVSIDFESGTAVVEGDVADPGAYEGALASVVTLKPLRRGLDRLRRAMPSRRSSEERA
jgi:copper chaperone CopZ